jgi:hypothetical protein
MMTPPKLAMSVAEFNRRYPAGTKARYERDGVVHEGRLVAAPEQFQPRRPDDPPVQDAMFEDGPPPPRSNQPVTCYIDHRGVPRVYIEGLSGPVPAQFVKPIE